MADSTLIDGGGGSGEGPMDIDSDGGGGVKRKRDMVKGEEEMKRVAELVLILSAMARMRGGREPTEVEKAVMDEARKKVVSLCEEFSPKDVVPREAFSGVIDDLGLNRLKDHRLGYRAPKLSISDKIALTKRRMKESNAFAEQSASYPTQRSQTGSETASENRGTLPPVRVHPADKAGHVSVSVGTFQSPTPVTHTSPVAQTSLVQVSPAVHGATVALTPLGVSAPVTRSAVKDFNTGVPSRSDRAHIRPDGRLNGPSSVPQAPANSPADRHTVRTTVVHLQTQPSSRVNIGAKNKAPDQMPVRVSSTSGPQMTAPSAAIQTPKPVVSQTAPGTMPTLHHPVQGLQYGHPAVINRHLEYAEIVHKLLNPNTPQCPTWTPPSRDYMNKAHPCQFCKLIINEVETVVICDACEKAFHLGCLQSHNVKGIPRGEWHCPRCVTMSHGKPFPPKYGRVTRNMNTPKGPSNTSVAHFASEKKTESLNEKATQPNTTTYGSVNVRAPSQGVNVAEQSYGSKNSHDIGTGRIKSEAGPNIGSYPENKRVSSMGASLSTSVGSSGDKPPLQVLKSEVSHPKDGLVSETEFSIPVLPQENSVLKNLPSSSNQNELDHKVSNCAETPLFQCGDSNRVVECNASSYNERCEYDRAKQDPVITHRIQDQARVIVETSESKLDSVEWIGEIDRVVDGKIFFRSCRINGVVYHLQNYALFRTTTGKLTPLRLQGMWEDSQTNSKWLLVHRCYFSDDLPSEVGRPGAPQINEVYESTHDSSVMAGSVQGLCEVLPFRKFGEEAGISDPGSQGNGWMGPVFIRNWFYDESKQAFCPSAS